MKIFFLSFLVLTLIPGCHSFSLDGAEEHMTEDCKCENFIDTGGDLYIIEKKGSVQPCGRHLGDTLKYGYIINNDNCEAYLPFKYQDARHFSSGLAPVKNNNKWGVIDKFGKLVIDYKYEDLQPFSDSLALFSAYNQYGFINYRGDTLISADLDFASSFWADIAVIKKNNYWNIINTKGEYLPVKIDSLIQEYNFNESNIGIYRGGNKEDETFEFPFYSNGEKVKLWVGKKKFVLLPIEEKIDFSTFDDSLAIQNLQPIYK